MTTNFNIMNHIFSVLVLVALILPAAYGQRYENDQQINTLIDNDPWISHGGYGALTTKYTEILDQDAFFLGLRGGWIINHRFTLGLAGNGLVSQIENDLWLPEDPIPGLEARLYTGYGGLLLEPIVFHRYPFHLSFPTVVGAGGATYGFADEDYGCCDHQVDFINSGWAYFVLEPGTEVEINLTRFMRINLGASYLYTSDVNMPEVDPGFMRGFMGSFAIKFGGF